MLNYTILNELRIQLFFSENVLHLWRITNVFVTQRACKGKRKSRHWFLSCCLSLLLRSNHFYRRDDECKSYKSYGSYKKLLKRLATNVRYRHYNAAALYSVLRLSYYP